MTRLSISIFAVCFLEIQTSFAYFYSLECKGNYQPQVGTGTETVILSPVDVGSFGDLKLTSTLREYNFEVIWHKSLDTFYMNIKNKTQNLLFSTARVPSFEHNDSMADIVQQDGTRLWISCNYVPK